MANTDCNPQEKSDSSQVTKEYRMPGSLAITLHDQMGPRLLVQGLPHLKSTLSVLGVLVMTKLSNSLPNRIGFTVSLPNRKLEYNFLFKC